MPVSIGQFKVIKASKQAIMVRPLDDEARENLREPTAWFPNSQVHDDSEVYKEGQEGQLIITDWLAEKRGWS